MEEDGNELRRIRGAQVSRLNDDAIAAEDGPALPFPPRTLEAWLQLNATEKVADDIGRLAGGVEWSALALAAQRPSGEFVWAAISDAKSQLTRAAWGGVRLSDPIVAAALEAAGREEVIAKYSKVYRCSACLEADDLSALFEWGGALFIHLLTCPHFAKANDR